MEAISVSYLLAIGILFIGLEAMTFSFVLFFFGLGFIFVALISTFIVFENAYIQIALAFVLALFLAVLLRKTLLLKLSKTSTQEETRTHVSGVGYVEDGTVKFDGTYWKTLDDLSQYKDGDRVEVIDVKENMVVLK